LETGTAVSMRSELLVEHEYSCRCWRRTLSPCKVRNKFIVNFWNRTILLCIPCISQKSNGENHTTHFISSNFLSETKHVVYEIMWKNMLGSRQAVDDNMVRRMRIACWIPRTTNTLRICNTYRIFTTADVSRILLNFFSSSFSFVVLQLMLPEAPQPYGLLYYPYIGHSNFLH
jgi:hypothetical protein